VEEYMQAQEVRHVHGEVSGVGVETIVNRPMVAVAAVTVVDMSSILSVRTDTAAVADRSVLAGVETPALADFVAPVLVRSGAPVLAGSGALGIGLVVVAVASAAV
jgi:hypothetical protein